MRVYHPGRDARRFEKFEAVLAEWTGPECTIKTIAFDTEDENDALEVAEDLALLEGSELIYFQKFKSS